VERILRLRSTHASSHPRAATRQLIHRALEAELLGETGAADESWELARLLGEAYRSVSGSDALLRPVERYRFASADEGALYLEASDRYADLDELLKAGDLEGARAVLDEAAVLWRKLEDPANEAAFLFAYCGALSGGAGGWEEFESCNREAAGLFARAGQERAQAVCLKSAARGLDWIGRRSQALETIRFALGLVEALNDDWMVMRLRVDEGVQQINIWKTDKDARWASGADEALSRAAELAGHLEDDYWESVALEYLAEVRMDRGRRGSANRLLLRVVELRESLGMPTDGVLEGHRGKYLRDAGEHLQALRYLRHERARFSPADSPGELMYLWWETAKNHEALSEWDEAARAYEEALALARQLGNDWNHSAFLTLLGSVACRRGDEEAASRWFAAQRQLIEDWPADRRHVIERSSLALKLEECGRFEEQREQLARVIALTVEAGLDDWQAYERSRLGLSLLNAGDVAGAGKQARAVRELLPAADASGWGFRGMRVDPLEVVARWHAARGEHAEAWTWHEELLEELDRCCPLAETPLSEHEFVREDQEAVLTTLHALVGAAAGAEGLLDVSLRLAQSVQAVRLRTLVAEDEELDGDEGVEAFEHFEVRQARVLEDLASVRLELDRSAEPEAQAALQERLAALEQEHDLLLLRRESAQRARRRGELLRLEPLTLDELRARLRTDSAAVQFFLGKRHAFAWVLRSDSARFLQLAPAPEIVELASFYLESASSPRLADAAANASAELSGLLIEPLLAALGDAERVVFVPDGVLHRLPLEALAPEGGDPLVATREVAYLPALALLGREHSMEAGAAGSGRTALVVGDWQEPEDAASLPAAWRQERGDYHRGGAALTPLANARLEARSVAKLFSRGHVKLLVGDASSEAAVKEEDLARFDVLHFATHAIADERSPMRSALVLAPSQDQDGFLQVRELADLDLNADLVVLSGCSTGSGRLVTGEGVEGLARAFLVAGARSLVVSLWNVDDRSTALLMESFHAKLRAGRSPAAALREAKLELRTRFQGRYADPYYWAPFVLIGEVGG
jgi:CHAT domain-containing protein/tetratricopeptide (TPR) repeat protein